ncbi:GNAT family N-acetyltransferase [Micromonospora sp. DT81.3]|uniref:GNAT family N-acetyltransferase n=1 Tax=Micromonospora sp. DT81.3 TaxID=3416523 RepID=UPI003CF625F2
MEPVTLTTARLVLSAPAEDDIDPITAGCQDPEVWRYTPVPFPYERHHAEEFVANTARWWDTGSDYVWSIHSPEAFAGMVGLHRVKGGEAEIGYWMSPGARGRGYLTEAARAVIDFAFAEPLKLERVEWRAVVGNVPSARSARSLGFRYEGLLRAGLASPRGRDDGWIAGLLAGDDRSPQSWPVLES